MRWLLGIVSFILALGGGTSAFGARDPGEARADAGAALLGLAGFGLLAYLRKREIGGARFKEELGLTPKFVRGMGSFLVLSVVLPCLLYWIIRGHLAVNWDGGEGILAMALATGGFVAFIFFIDR